MIPTACGSCIKMTPTQDPGKVVSPTAVLFGLGYLCSMGWGSLLHTRVGSRPQEAPTKIGSKIKSCEKTPDYRKSNTGVRKKKRSNGWVGTQVEMVEAMVGAKVDVRVGALVEVPRQ